MAGAVFTTEDRHWRCWLRLAKADDPKPITTPWRKGDEALEIVATRQWYIATVAVALHAARSCIERP